MALESYAKIAMNTEAERKAPDVRLRAERRCGELLKELARSKGGYAPDAAASVAGASPYREALKSTGLSERSAARSGIGRSPKGEIRRSPHLGSSSALGPGKLAHLGVQNAVAAGFFLFGTT
jgi:hypothetical protein